MGAGHLSPVLPPTHIGHLEDTEKDLFTGDSRNQRKKWWHLQEAGHSQPFEALLAAPVAEGRPLDHTA